MEIKTKEAELRMEIMKKHLSITTNENGCDTFFAYHEAMQEYADQLIKQLEIQEHYNELLVQELNSKQIDWDKAAVQFTKDNPKNATYAFHWFRDWFRKEMEGL